MQWSIFYWYAQPQWSQSLWPKKMQTSFSKDMGYITPEVLPRNNTESNGDYIMTYRTRMYCLITLYAAQRLLNSILLMGLQLLPLPLMLALCTLLNGRLMTVWNYDRSLKATYDQVSEFWQLHNFLHPHNLILGAWQTAHIYLPQCTVTTITIFFFFADFYFLSWFLAKKKPAIGIYAFV